MARKLEPPPAVPPFYVQVPDEVELRAVGWYMRRARDQDPEFLGHNAIAAEIWLRRELEQEPDKRKEKAGAKPRKARAKGRR